MKPEAGAPVAKQGKPKRGSTKRVPMRTCIGTRTQHPKRDMIRLVKAEDGHILIDLTGKRSGSRGVYLTKSRAAAEQAIRHKRFEAEFEQPLSKEDEEAILAYFNQFN
jgi:predicted RNA-binding protein YlxR (DUF448 family)